MKWTVGLITAPRRDCYYLNDTLRSLTESGFGDVVVFAEPGSVVPEWHTGPVVRRWKQFGDWTNWATGLFELLLAEPDSDYYFMSEDDGLFCKGMRAYLERTLPTIGEFATVSPYCPGRYHKPGFVGYHDECNGPLTWSTLTVIMSRAGVRSFFSDPDVQRHRFEDIFPTGIRWGVEVPPCNSVKDAVLGLWALKNNLPMFYHTPCLASHIGISSTLSSKNTNWENLAADFVGEGCVPAWETIKVKRTTKLPLL